MQALRMVIAGGGTGGHVLPAVAVIEELELRGQPLDLLWIGSASGLEREEAVARGIPFVAIRTGKLRRYIDPHTVPDAIRIPVGTIEAWRHLRRFGPDVVFSTGGFVSVPSVLASWRMAPAVTHEQTAVLGLANRINARVVRAVAVSFADTADRCASVPGNRLHVTGNPVRASLAQGAPAAAAERFGLDPGQPLVYVTGGARGASPINTRVEAVLPQLLQMTQIVHQTGPQTTNNDFQRLCERRSHLPKDLRDRYYVTEYVRDGLADLYAASSLVVSRSGAGMIAELAVLGKPSILIPLPGSGGNEQMLNAAVLGDLGAAVVLDQDDATSDRLLDEIGRLLADPERLASMGEKARAASAADAAARLADLILAVASAGTRRG
jgi:UDP-N-acetylglucosamine--N-acetylmuramyl-(pentapeptide) pyrophosphoryl-undecaprenol N-acetylglucosamine transferase